MWGVYRLFLLASVCMVFVLAGCVPIQPEAPAASRTVAGFVSAKQFAGHFGADSYPHSATAGSAGHRRARGPR